MIFMYSNLFTSGSIQAWRAAERFFIEYFGFLFDNTVGVRENGGLKLESPPSYMV